LDVQQIFSSHNASNFTGSSKLVNEEKKEKEKVIEEPPKQLKKQSESAIKMKEQGEEIKRHIDNKKEEQNSPLKKIIPICKTNRRKSKTQTSKNIKTREFDSESSYSIYTSSEESEIEKNKENSTAQMKMKRNCIDNWPNSERKNSTN